MTAEQASIRRSEVRAALEQNPQVAVAGDTSAEAAGGGPAFDESEVRWFVATPHQGCSHFSEGRGNVNKGVSIAFGTRRGNP